MLKLGLICIVKQSCHGSFKNHWQTVVTKKYIPGDKQTLTMKVWSWTPGLKKIWKKIFRESTWHLHRYPPLTQLYTSAGVFIKAQHCQFYCKANIVLKTNVKNNFGWKSLDFFLFSLWHWAIKKVILPNSKAGTSLRLKLDTLLRMTLLGGPNDASTDRVNYSVFH